MKKIEEKFSRYALSLKGSEIRRLFSISMRPEVISFAGGLPDSTSFPSEKMAEIMKNLLKTKGQQLLQYGPSRGTKEGISAAIDRMRRREIEVKSDEVIITNGGQQAIELAVKILDEPGDVVIVENPTFIGALGVMRSTGVSLAGVPMDDDGIIPNELIKILENFKDSNERVKFLYTIPNFHNPTGITLAQKRRIELLEIAKKYDIFIVEDDPYGELWFEGGLESVKPLKAFDSNSRVIYIGSFSKVISPGIRIGWTAAHNEIIDRFDMARQMTDVCPNLLIQAAVAEMCESGFLNEHIEQLRSIYKSRCKAMLDALEEYMPEEVSWTKPKGGFYIWVTMPETIDALKILDSALDNNVAYIIGSAFFSDKSGKNMFRISFCHETEEVINEGIKRLGNTVEQVL